MVSLHGRGENVTERGLRYDEVQIQQALSPLERINSWRLQRDDHPVSPA